MSFVFFSGDKYLNTLPRLAFCLSFPNAGMRGVYHHTTPCPRPFKSHQACFGTQYKQETRAPWATLRKGLRYPRLPKLSSAHGQRSRRLEGTQRSGITTVLLEDFWLAENTRCQNLERKEKSCNYDYLVSPCPSANPDPACCRYLTISETLRRLC